MKTLLKMALGACLVGATPLAFSLSATPARAAETAPQKAGRAAIAAQYARVDAAIVRRDVPTVMSTLADDYRGYGMDGSVENRAQAEAALRILLSGRLAGVTFKITKSQTAIQSLQWRGPDAIVMLQTTMVGVGRRGDKTVRVEIVGVGRDYWGKTARGWQVRQSVQTQMKRWINGVRDPSL